MHPVTTEIMATGSTEEHKKMKTLQEIFPWIPWLIILCWQLAKNISP